MYIDDFLTQGLGFGWLYVSKLYLLYESKFPMMVFLVTIWCSLPACFRGTWSLYGIVVHGSNEYAMMRRTSLQNHSVNFMNVTTLTLSE